MNIIKCQNEQEWRPSTMLGFFLFEVEIGHSGLGSTKWVDKVNPSL
jgi:hypothetical protein